MSVWANRLSSIVIVAKRLPRLVLRIRARIGYALLGGIGDTRPLLVLNVAVEKLNAPTQITDERLTFYGGAGMVR
ncbi:hypothetical protein ACRQ5Q_41680 (plasmid) [Bradyrhizobium sp. PMVTL-01]|uniref:hypothetical protein n=1 Tax=Bradyrhizobium sp. PMVTL-01 TaxID=3434999 RepID=UPI003F6EAAB9